MVSLDKINNYCDLVSLKTDWIIIIVNNKSDWMGKTVENYMIQEALGEGNFAKVFKAKNIKTGQDFAIKVIPT